MPALDLPPLRTQTQQLRSSSRSSSRSASPLKSPTSSSKSILEQYLIRPVLDPATNRLRYELIVREGKPKEKDREKEKETETEKENAVPRSSPDDNDDVSPAKCADATATITELPLVSKPAPELRPRYAPENRVKIVAVHRKNMGVRTKTFIRAREVIFTEFPLIQLPSTTSVVGDEGRLEYFLHQELAALPPEKLRNFYALYNKHRLWSSNRPPTQAQQIWDTNCVRDDSDCYLFETSARVNHDCWPNAKFSLYRTDAGLTYARVVALADIRAGDEITFSYTKKKLGVERRRLDLAREWGFFCQCPRCRRESSIRPPRPPPPRSSP